MGKKNVNSKSSYGAGDANITVSGLAPDFYADRISKMATTAGHRLALDPMGKCSNAFF